MIRWEGLTPFHRKLGLAMGNGPASVVETLVMTSERIITASKQSYVPVDLGALRASGFVAPPIQEGSRISVEMGFGGPSAPYAVVQHEDLTLRHTVGQAKYLEIPFRAIVQGMPAVMAMRARDAIRQAFQRLRKIEANIRGGRSTLWGMPLFRGPTG